MGSLWYHGHTICISQGLTLSTASLVTSSNSSFFCSRIDAASGSFSPFFGEVNPSSALPLPPSLLTFLTARANFFMLMIICWSDDQLRKDASIQSKLSITSCLFLLRAESFYDVLKISKHLVSSFFSQKFRANNNQQTKDFDQGHKGSNKPTSYH